MIFKDATIGCGGGAACHTAGFFPPDFSVPDIASEVKGMKTTFLCPGQNMVDPANPMNSVLYKVLVNADCNEQMPKDRAPLSASQMACVADWIAKL